jgi:hypothetical protein
MMYNHHTRPKYASIVWIVAEDTQMAPTCAAIRNLIVASTPADAGQMDATMAAADYDARILWFASSIACIM